MSDTAELIARMRQTFQVTGDKWFGLAADRLAAQAQEIERLKKDHEDSLREVFRANQAQDAAEARVRELEALLKCDGCGKPFDEDGGCCPTCFSEGIAAHLKPLKAELAATFAATKERCAEMAEDRMRNLWTRDDVAAAIRALDKAHQDQQETNHAVGTEAPVIPSPS